MNILLYLAGGEGKRFGRQNKLFLPLNGKPLFLRALQTFFAPSRVHELFMKCSQKVCTCRPSKTSKFPKSQSRVHETFMNCSYRKQGGRQWCTVHEMFMKRSSFPHTSLCPSLPPVHEMFMKCSCGKRGGQGDEEQQGAVHELFMNFSKGQKQEIQRWMKRDAKIRKQKISLFPAGKTRQGSVRLLLKAITKVKKKPEFLIIHNAANPFVTEEEIFRCFDLLKKHPSLSGVAVGRPLTNTLKKIFPPRSTISLGTVHEMFMKCSCGRRGEEERSEWKMVEKTIRREKFWETETPQIVRHEPFLEAHEKAAKEKFETTDDIGLLEWAGYKTAVLPASENNFKITTLLDYEFAKFLASDFPSPQFGYGEDSHAFSRTHCGLKLGGLYFKKFPKLEADSDGDVILHAIATALSQAINEGSLGKFATPLFKKLRISDSRKYVEYMLKKIHAKNLVLQKINLVIEGSRPKIDPLTERLKKSLSKILKIPAEQISIAAHTGKNLTSFGRGEGLRCAAATMVFPQKIC